MAEFLSQFEETSGITIYWRIENFEPDPSFDFIKSQVFKIQSMDTSWQIQVHVKDMLAAFLFKMSNNAPFSVHYSTYLLTGSGWITVFDNIRHKFRTFGDGNGGNIVDLRKLNNKEWFYLPNGSLTLCFRIWNNRTMFESHQRLMISRLIDGDYLRHRQIQNFTTLKPSDFISFPLTSNFLGGGGLVPTSNVQIPKAQQIAKEVKTQETQTDASYDFNDLEDLRKLFKEKEFSFVTLRTPTKEFSVLKAALCSKSPVFAAMFEKNMKEKECKVVNIDDIDNQTIALLVNFLHFEPLDSLEWSSAASLYYAADKYQIDSLKEQCSSLLKKELSIESVCDLLVLADLHQDDDLMNCAQEYFCKHTKAILPSTQWRDILSHTELVAKVLSKLADTMH